ncbi:UNVERIFIED_CONTAM: hypothetical protein NY603_20525, partial [Bacteroidetes bacterium 56_B9]
MAQSEVKRVTRLPQQRPQLFAHQNKHCNSGDALSSVAFALHLTRPEVPPPVSTGQSCFLLLHHIESRILARPYIAVSMASRNNSSLP